MIADQAGPHTTPLRGNRGRALHQVIVRRGVRRTRAVAAQSYLPVTSRLLWVMSSKC